MPHYKATPLFGGAMVCDLPENFADVSKVRQVPDNQEVWIDQDGFASIIFDLTERVGPPGSSAEIDGTALTTHLEDIVGTDIDTVKVWNTSDTQMTRLSESIPAYTLIATQTPRADESKGPATFKFTAIILTLVRLEHEATDLLITINVPHIKGAYDEEEVDLEMGKTGALIGGAVEHAARIWESLNIKDWTLFGAS